ncbi:TPA: DUF1433 domain-containing protein [Streptococcus equi subsp. zooepidemicus]|uniref:DUF1433 domain-containing protein n=2 Tax=Streptococcus equi TaxID=1336 RepID=A0A6M1L0V8_9STRE|nr:DUF1433 domain-containing protein [Streptococcus equi]NGL84484.1 DUF1433 domain-containing protein [Streptococcus equi subsp. ruminatorum]QUQ80025.1 hypothetical protein LJFMMFNO_01031 [Streptococcus equi subsp. zooepidemicus]WOK58116.1 DUF1433 domain-containing protein [Streptococcus equi subsp. zooepidemicus]HEK9097281.1 DUF1433 domain-containing protein [Streptococcus equi subsp. zooepidemicus]HEL1066833.1 DUF1433 domain-containing protein [Streptococcus equi subsp. zooepidemicus]
MIVKKKVIILLGIVAILVMGGMAMFNSFTGKDEPRYKHEQDRMVEYLAQNYEGIEKVEFTDIDHNAMTGTYNFDATVNDKIEVRFVLRGLKGDIYMNELYSRNFGNRLIKLDEPIDNLGKPKIRIVYKEER